MGKELSSKKGAKLTILSRQQDQEDLQSRLKLKVLVNKVTGIKILIFLSNFVILVDTFFLDLQFSINPT